MVMIEILEDNGDLLVPQTSIRFDAVQSYYEADSDIVTALR